MVTDRDETSSLSAWLSFNDILMGGKYFLQKLESFWFCLKSERVIADVHFIASAILFPSKFVWWNYFDIQLVARAFCWLSVCMGDSLVYELRCKFVMVASFVALTVGDRWA